MALTVTTDPRTDDSFLDSSKLWSALTTRDNQKKRVYKSGWNAPKGKHFFMLSDVQAYIDQVVLTDRWFQNRYPHIRRVVVQRGKAKYKASAGKVWKHGRREYMIDNMPQWSRNQVYIFHELAHIVTADYRGYIAAHGPEYAREFLELYNHFTEYGDKLREQYRLHGVKVAPANYREKFMKIIDRVTVENTTKQPVSATCAHVFVKQENGQNRCTVCGLWRLTFNG